jgi:hypothetical protein
MNAADTPICPIPGLGYFLYYRYSYWDAEYQEIPIASAPISPLFNSIKI